MLESDAALENRIRRLIYNHIISNPGVSFLILRKIFNLNDSTLRYHLNYLEKSEKISIGVDKGKRNYYPFLDSRLVIENIEDSNGIEIYELTKVQEQIISTIKTHPRINQKELMIKTGINRLTLSKNIKKLMGICIVRRIPNGNKVQYEYIPNEQLRYEILKRLLKRLLSGEIDEKRFIELKRKLDSN